jgi:hypothetical protein
MDSLPSIAAKRLDAMTSLHELLNELQLALGQRNVTLRAALIAWHLDASPTNATEVFSALSATIDTTMGFERRARAIQATTHAEVFTQRLLVDGLTTALMGLYTFREGVTATGTSQPTVYLLAVKQLDRANELIWSARQAAGCVRICS